jgi:colanic acid/amylovoran biosynthesis glycosyltransferase
MRLAYVVSRFPHVSETFILRELDAVAATPGIDAELLSLFPPVDPTVHDAARPWVPRVHRPTAWEGARAMVAWMRSRPLRTMSSTALVIRGYGRRPRLLLRALVTIPLAAAHARRLQRLGVEHVHAHYATYPALSAWWGRRLAGIPYSITPHAHDIYMDQSMLARKVGDATFVVAISEFNRRFLAPYGAGRRTPVHLVRYGIVPAAYPFRRRRLPAEGPIRALCVASLQEYKGHAVLLRALASGGGAVDRIQLSLIGGGELLGELERLVDRLGLGGRVRFLGARREDEVIEHLDASDLFVLPSIISQDGQMEGLPNVLIEARACGLPVVTTRLSGIPELVEDGRSGLLVPPGDVRRLAGALRRLAQDPALAAQLGAAGRAVVEADFDVHRSAERLVELFTGRLPVAGAAKAG